MLPNALLYAFYPGPMGGKAVAEMLYGSTQSVRPSSGIHAAPRRSDSGVLQLPDFRCPGVLRYDEPAAAYLRRRKILHNVCRAAMFP